ncbi:hypothetical protein FSP39_012122 [Pinctada imbricata]|uniref:Uncharacterized protein n=1 Tax=Pinctada imbricata TaxID=66713 RepID=A0AA88YW30_PINIB|nr:hypothetical protein FSP39_012122 [Pinctada imbricata]
MDMMPTVCFLDGKYKVQCHCKVQIGASPWNITISCVKFSLVPDHGMLPTSNESNTKPSLVDVSKDQLLIILECRMKFGNPPLPLRWCIDSGNGQFRQYISNKTRDFSSPGIGQQDRCILTSTSITTYDVTDRDVGINIRLRCEIVNFNRAPCSSRNQLRDVTITGINKNNPNMDTTTRNPPVIIIDTGIVEIPSTTTPGIKIETEVVGIPSSTTPGMDLSARIESLPTETTTAGSTLIIGAILIVIAIICIVGALVLMLKARTIKKDAELAITRSTYDALNNKQQNSLDLYQTLNGGKRSGGSQNTIKRKVEKRPDLDI